MELRDTGGAPERGPPRPLGRRGGSLISSSRAPEPGTGMEETGQVGNRPTRPTGKEGSREGSREAGREEGVFSGANKINETREGCFGCRLPSAACGTQSGANGAPQPEGNHGTAAGGGTGEKGPCSGKAAG